MRRYNPKSPQRRPLLVTVPREAPKRFWFRWIVDQEGMTGGKGGDQTSGEKPGFTS